MTHAGRGGSARLVAAVAVVLLLLACMTGACAVARPPDRGRPGLKGTVGSAAAAELNIITSYDHTGT